MSTFKFGFSKNDDDDPDSGVVSADEPKVDLNERLQTIEIIPDDDIINEVEELIEYPKIFECNSASLKYVPLCDAIVYLENCGKNLNLENISASERLHSDLVEGKYEGGFKIWECTSDLAEYVIKNEVDKLKTSTVLDLGCGAGMLGIITLTLGANVHFQDYNEEVIIGSTIPNVLLNMTKDERTNIKNSCRFFSGDWSTFSSITSKEKPVYDYILTSETIYNIENYSHLYCLIKDHLKRTGIALIAAKSYYFGVGGSTREFQTYVQKDGIMDTAICWKCEEGVPREILKLSFKKDI